MKFKQMINIVLATSLLTSFIPANAMGANESQKLITVRMTNFIGNQTAISIQVKGTYVVAGAEQYELKDSSYTIEKSGNDLVVTQYGRPYLTLKSGFTLKPKTYNQTNTLTLMNGSKLTYLGNMKFTLEDGYIRPYNTLSIEDYLKGVLPSEMSPSWSVEALKAQAVAARNFTMPYAGKEISDTTSHQTYKGYVQNVPNSDRAVEETKGKILTYNGKVAQLFYSTENGGYIESNNGAWGGTGLPYLAAKADPYDPAKEQAYTITEENLISKMQKHSTVKIETIDEIRVIERTDGQRAKTVRFTINKGANSFTVKGTDVRYAIGVTQLRSTYFNDPIKEKDVFTFTTKGFGHGVGMSQTGAKVMADSGKTYTDILGFYFKGATLGTTDTTFTGDIPALPATIVKVDTIPQALKVHVVQKGETRAIIAAKYNIDIDQILEWNNLKTPILMTGQVLIVSNPNAEGAQPTPTPPKDTTPPADVTNTKATTTASAVTLTFTKPTDADFSHTMIYRNNVLAKDKETTTSFIDKGLKDNTNYTYTIKTVDKSGNVSKGITVTAKTKDGTPPAEVSNVKTSATTNAITLSFTKPKEADFSHITITQNNKVVQSKGTATTWTATGLAENTNYTFVLKTVDTAGNTSKGVTVTVQTAKRVTTPTTSKTHTVKKGDTLSSIARQYNTTYQTLMTWNNLKTTTIKLGQVLVVNKTTQVATPPPTSTVTTKSATVTATTLNMRSGAGTNYGIVTTLKKNQVVTVNSVTGKWAYVTFGTKKGYLHTDYITMKTTTVTTSKPSTTPSTPNTKTHVVAKSETLYAIATKYKVSVAQIQSVNKLTTTTIKVGQVLLVQN